MTRIARTLVVAIALITSFIACASSTGPLTYTNDPTRMAAPPDQIRYCGELVGWKPDKELVVATLRNSEGEHTFKLREAPKSIRIGTLFSAISAKKNVAERYRGMLVMSEVPTCDVK